MSELEQSSRSWWNSFYYLLESSLPVSFSSRDALSSDTHNLHSIKNSVFWNITITFLSFLSAVRSTSYVSVRKLRTLSSHTSDWEFAHYGQKDRLYISYWSLISLFEGCCLVKAAFFLQNVCSLNYLLYLCTVFKRIQHLFAQFLIRTSTSIRE